jgi:hypothetical protein
MGLCRLPARGPQPIGIAVITHVPLADFASIPADTINLKQLQRLPFPLLLPCFLCIPLYPSESPAPLG